MNQDRFGKFIKEIRKKNNLTQKEFADRYNLIFEQMNNRNAPQEQIEQLKSEIDNIKKSY